MPTRPDRLAKRHARGSTSEIQQLRAELSREKLAREAVERENAELRAKVASLEDRIEELIASQRRMEDFLQGHIRRLEKDVADRDEKLDNANKQLQWFRKRTFDSTTEQAPLAEEEQSEPVEEAAVLKPGKARKRGQQPGSKGHGRSDYSGIPTDEQLVSLEACACPSCGKHYKLLNRTEKSPLIELHLTLLLTNYLRQIYVPACSCPGGKPLTAPAPTKLYDRTKFGNSVWVYLIVQKFLFGVPTNRTLKELQLKGLPVSQGTITGGFQRINGLIESLYEGIVNHCRGGSYWHADETSWRVFGSGGKKWWFWLIASEDAVVYVLDPSRSAAVPEEFFAGSVGTVMTDRLSAYKGLHDGIRKALCWVHVRRDFLKIFEGTKKLRNWAKEWLEQIGKLFATNEKRFKLWESKRSFGEQWRLANAELRDHVRQMEQTWQSQLNETNLHSQQKKVLSSLKRHWTGLTLFVADPRVPLHNNRAERLLRNPVVLRKNSFGSGSEWSGKFSARLFSILQTWLINGLDPESLLLDFFDEASKPGRAPPNLHLYLPWNMSAERKQQFALPKSYRRPG